MTDTTPTPTSERALDETTDRLEMPQYSLGQILAVWVAVTVPMGLLAWVITPWLGTGSAAATRSSRHSCSASPSGCSG